MQPKFGKSFTRMVVVLKNLCEHCEHTERDLSVVELKKKPLPRARSARAPNHFLLQRTTQAAT